MMVGVVADCGLRMIDIITDWCTSRRHDKRLDTHLE
jgi:hypothetical protein